MLQKLFGGAIEIYLPDDRSSSSSSSSSYLDSSTVRQVPDYQEIFTHSSLPISIIIEIFEQQNAPADLEHAVQYYFQETVAETAASVAEHSCTKVRRVDEKKCFMSGRICTKRHVHAEDDVFYLLFMGICRVTEREADILVSFSRELSGIDEELTVDYETMFTEMLKSVLVKDLSLFCN